MVAIESGPREWYGDNSGQQCTTLCVEKSQSVSQGRVCNGATMQGAIVAARQTQQMLEWTGAVDAPGRVGPAVRRSLGERDHLLCRCKQATSLCMAAMHVMS